MKKEQSATKGFLLFEVVLTSALLALFITAFVGAYLYGEQSAVSAGNRAQAVFLAEEALEAVRNIRDHSFSDLSDGTYGLSKTNVFELSDSEDVIGVFSREIAITEIDADRKNITVNVTWEQGPRGDGVISLSTQLTNWTAVVEEPI